LLLVLNENNAWLNGRLYKRCDLLSITLGTSSLLTEDLKIDLIATCLSHIAVGIAVPNPGIAVVFANPKSQDWQRPSPGISGLQKFIKITFFSSIK